MIQRIRTLEIENFRAYKGHHGPINLDGNVVLIHGYNGSGKTSLLHAIEYAVTGRVEHLAEFRADYPDKLSYRNPGHLKHPGRVSLTASMCDGVGDHIIERIVTSPRPIRGHDFSAETKSSYAGRSYLSQAHLARLLNIYQESRKGKKASPIVEFIRDFLELSDLEAIEAGLHNVGHKGRREREFKPIVKVKEAFEVAKTNVAARRVDATEARQKFDRALELLAAAAATAGVPLPSNTPEFKSFDLPLEERQNQAHAKARRFIEWIEIINAGVGLGNLPPLPRAGDPELVYKTLRTLARAIDAVRDTIGQPEVASTYAPPDISHTDPERAHVSLAHELQAWKERAKKTSFSLTTSQRSNAKDLQSAENDAERLAFLQSQAQKTLENLAESNNATQESVDEAGSLREALSAILPHIHNNDCPVCSRDFAETNQGDLRDQVIAVLDVLGVQTTRLQAQLHYRERLLSQQAQIQSEIATLITKSPAERVKVFKSRMIELDHAEAQLNSIPGLLETLSALVDDYADHARAATQRTSWIRSQEKVSKAIRSIQEQLDPAITSPMDAPISDANLSALLEQASTRADVLSNQAAALERVLQLSEAARAEAITNSEAQAALKAAETKHKRAETTYKEVDALVRRANAVRKAAGKTTGSLIERTFNDQLNSLVNDIYFRLVRDELFQPWITSKGTIRSLTAAVNAYVDGEKAAEDIASVVSSANLNTAALSLFIALHLASSTKPRTLVLDDPVQSMDDVHATNLAALFRSIAYHPTTPRQLILAVHDKALFEYLTLELGPTKQGDTLVEVRVARQSTGDVKVQSTTRTWQLDRVHFGEAS